MPEIPIEVWVVSIVSAIFFAWVGQQPNAPFFCRWPYVMWDAIERDWRRPAPVLERPDYAKIERLERELGIVEPEPEKPIRLARTVCLTKGCEGETTEVRTWSGMLAMRIHECERP